jgi:hypothetical protein
MNAEATFIRNMLAQRKHRNWSQARLATEANKHGLSIHPTAITKLEWALAPEIDAHPHPLHRPRGLRLDEAAAISQAFGLSLPDMLGELCATCLGSPPAGFTCQECGES